MPLFKLKKVWDYCTYNKPFFIFVLIIFILVNFIEDSFEMVNSVGAALIFILCIMVTSGYGLTITRDRANEGVRLPKIMLNDVLILGFKSEVVIGAYALVQGILLNLVCSPLGFPAFDLEDLLFNFKETIHLLIEHNPFNSLIFVILGAILFYITLFFLEIALAKLADSGKLSDSFNLGSIKKTIDIIGWWNYTKECTSIIVAIVILGFLKAYDLQIFYLDYFMDLLLDLFMFATQFLGIGAVYARYKEKCRQ